MKKAKKISWVLLLLLCFLKHEGFAQVVYDVDGNEYGTVIIGDRVWMTNNLKVTRYSDGTSIPIFDRSNDAGWGANTTGARASYLDSAGISNRYGFLYNGFAVENSSGLCPAGWRIPTDAEFQDLERKAGMLESDVVTGPGFRGADDDIAGVLRDTATTGDPKWKTNASSNNRDELGFSWDGGGYKFSSGAYSRDDLNREFGSLWSQTKDAGDSDRLYTRNTNTINPGGFFGFGNVNAIWRGTRPRVNGMSVRCITDATVQLDNSKGFRMISSPVDTNYAMFLDQIWTQGATGANTTEGEPNVWTWNSGTGAWSAVTDLTTELTAGTAILVHIFNDNDFDGVADPTARSLYIGGSLDTGDVSPSINSSANGYTLLGNPYNKTIDIDNISPTDLTGTIYIWDPTANSGSGQWETWSGSTGDITDGLIPPFQGFFVQTVSSPTSPAFTFTIDDTSATEGSFFGKAVKADPEFIRLYLSGNGMGSSMWLQFSEDGSIAEIVKGDANKLQPLSTDYALMAVNKNGNLMDIAHLPVDNESFTIPLNIETTKSGTFNLIASDFQLSDSYKLIFNDHAKEVSVPIKEDFSYELALDAITKKAVIATPLEIVNAAPLRAKSSSESGYSITFQKSASVNGELNNDHPERLALSQNYPNPFNPATVISFNLPDQEQVRLAVYDMLGREVAVLVDETRTAGSYQVTFNASKLSSGSYIYRLEAGGQILTQQMTLIK